MTSLLPSGLRLAAILVVTGCLTAVSANAQQVSSSVESGLQSLAQDIVTKSTAQDKNVIAVVPFPNSDGSCSVLSTYIADELIASFFAIPNSPVTVIERARLEAVFNEIQGREGGLLNPETTQSLGRISGVQALAVGTITQIGDRIRINARLVATDTGRTVSAANVSITRTSDMDALLRQPIAGEGGTCGIQITSRSRGVQGVAGSTTSFHPSPVDMSTAQASRGQTTQGLLINAKQVVRSPDKKTVSIGLSITNQSDEPIKLIMVRPKPSIVDGATNSVELDTYSGIQSCSANWATDAMNCKPHYKVVSWTTVAPNTPITVLLRFHSREAPIAGAAVSLAALLLKGPGIFSDNTMDGVHSIETVSVALADLSVSEAGAR